jgi:hypothetical protein
MLAASKLWRSPEMVYSSVADTYVSTAHPDVNHGAGPTLHIDGVPKIRSYLRFRLDRASGRIISARLRLWSPTGDLVGYSVHIVANTSWEERNLTWRSRPRAGAVVARSGPFGPESWGTADVTRLLEGKKQVAVALSTRSRQNITFDSREGSHIPQLTVKTQPHPKSYPPKGLFDARSSNSCRLERYMNRAPPGDLPRPNLRDICGFHTCDSRETRL